MTQETTPTESNHTPGPWAINMDDPEDVFITSLGGDREGLEDDVCKVYGGNDADPGRAIADARLIAASPTMLEELRHVAAIIKSSEGDYMTMAERLVESEESIRATIARATEAEA